MGSEMVVAGSDVAQRVIEVVGVAHSPLREHRFHRANEALDSAILPGTPGVGTLRADPQESQRHAESPRGEDGFVIGPQPSRRAVPPTCLDHVPQQREGGLVGKPLQPQARATRMIQDRQHQMLSPLRIGLDHQVQAPDEVAWDRPWHGVFELPASEQDRVLLPPDRVRDIGFADGHLFADSEATIKQMRNHAAPSVGHHCLQPNHFPAHPFGLRLGVRPADWSTRCGGSASRA